MDIRNIWIDMYLCILVHLCMQLKTKSIKLGMTQKMKYEISVQIQLKVDYAIFYDNCLEKVLDLMLPILSSNSSYLDIDKQLCVIVQ